MSLLPSPLQRRFERYMRRYQHRIYGFAVYFLGDPVAAEDVVQDVLLRLWEHRNDIDEERMLGWLLRVTRNTCIDVLRKRKAYRNVVTSGETLTEEAPGQEPWPDEEAVAADFEHLLMRALTQVPEPYRSIVILREVQELKYEEISGAMDLPLNTVKVYLHRGRKMLREHVNKVMHREAV